MAYNRKKKYYTVDWYRNGFCYRTTVNVPYENLKDCRRTAKLLGEKIEIEKQNEKYSNE